MEIIQQGDVYVVIGDITELVDFSSFRLPKGEVRLDMGGVRSMNSCGAREWINWLSNSSMTAIYLRCSQTIVMQFNMIKDFLQNGEKVESFLVPTFCETCRKEGTLLLRSGHEFTPGTIPAFKVKKCGEKNCSLEPEVDLDSYCAFVKSLKR